jgi:hypothetical protein
MPAPSLSENSSWDAAGDRAGPDRMHKLMVATAGTLELPTVGPQQLDQLAALHLAYFSHCNRIRQRQLCGYQIGMSNVSKWPTAAVRCNAQ